MSKLREDIKNISLTQVLLFAIAAFLLLIGLEMETISSSLRSINRNLTNPIGVDVQQH